MGNIGEGRGLSDQRSASAMAFLNFVSRHIVSPFLHPLRNTRD